MNHPYKSQPPTAFWRHAMVATPLEAVNPAGVAPFSITPSDAVVTAGSCFAQHIGPMLRAIRFNFLTTEDAHPIADAALARQFGYGVFSARYGNIYTARQLLQLWYRAYGAFTAQEDVWAGPGGNFIDPFRPQIQPGGFLSWREYKLDRELHFAAVRQAFETLDVFVFTLGLTECWRARADGAVFPLCPGVAGGHFDPAQHEFHNFSVEEITSDLIQFIDTLRRRNPSCKMILTVSPVPLVATATESHVLAATTYSKAVLRVAAEAVTRARARVAYFPSYEIIMSQAHGKDSYFGPDRREVTNGGVAHVMRVFAETYAGFTSPLAPPVPAPATGSAYTREMAAAMQVLCDELALDPG